VLGLLILPVPSQESEQSCICVRVIDLPISTIFSTITLTHKYMTAHSPGLVQAKSITLTHKYMTAHSPGLVQEKSITLTQIHDRSLSWLGTGKINNPDTNT
jgi:hypothetical protein